MRYQPLRASSSLLSHLARNATPATTRRSFIAAAAVRQPDIVQELYLRELRAYKPPAVRPSDAEGHVQKFNMPKPPKLPEDISLATQMQEYESSGVEVEGQAPGEETAEPEKDFFEDLKDVEEGQPAPH